MSFSIILGMFPGVLSMIAVYFVLKMIGLTDSLAGLVIVYSAGSGLGFLVLKGFFDTIPVSLREAARLEGASEATIFGKINYSIVKTDDSIYDHQLFPESMDGFCSGTNHDQVQRVRRLDSRDRSLYLLQKTLIGDYFAIFCAGGVMIAIPISILFVVMQKFYVEGVTGGAVKG